jgi:tRNA(Ile)-lysidine synthetase-like protein
LVDRISRQRNNPNSRLSEKVTVSVINNENGEFLHHTVEWNYNDQKSIQWEKFIFSCENVKSVSDEDLSDQSHDSIYFASLELPEKLIIRKRIPGDRMIPFSQDSEVKIKKLLQDTDLKVEEKKNIPIIATPDGKIIWVPGVRRANFANISDLTEHILKFSMKNIVL